MIMKNIFMPDIPLEQRMPLTLETVGENESQSKVERPNGYPAYHCILCKSGNGFLYADGAEYFIEPNSFFMLRPNQRHKYYPDGIWHTCWIVFNGLQAEKILSGLKLYNSAPRKLPHSSTAFTFYDLIYRAALDGSRKSIFEASSLLYSMMLDLSYSSVYGFGSENSYARGVDVFLKYIGANWQKNIGLSEIASAMNITPQYLCKICAEKLGTTPYDYLISYRLQKSKEIMMDGGLTIKEVSKLSGFNDVSYFCAVFRKHEGITPRRFRETFYSGQRM